MYAEERGGGAGGEEQVKMVPPPPSPPSASSNGPSLGRRFLSSIADSVACCVCAPLKFACSVIGVLVAIAVVLGIILLVWYKYTSTGKDTITTISNHLETSFKDYVAAYVNTATDSDLIKLVYRRHVNTISVSFPYETPLQPAFQGWVTIQPARFEFSFTFNSLVDENELGPVVLAHFGLVSQTWSTITLWGAGPPVIPLPNRTWQQTLTCPSPWTHCQEVLGAFLTSEYVAVLFLRAGHSADRFPILASDALLHGQF